MNIAVITGASSGLGREFALQIDSLFHNLDEIWLIARRRERLEELSGVLRAKGKVIRLDVTDDTQMRLFEEVLKLADPAIRMLVNCAGFGLMGKFGRLDLKEQLDMLEVNCKALTQMTYLCLPYMKQNSRIIQLASSAAFLPQPDFAVYAATKSYVLSFSRSVGEEVRKKGIYVTAVCPGPVSTEFFDIAEQYGTTLTVKKLTMVGPDRVVRDALRASYRKKAVSVCSPIIKAYWVCCKLVPHSCILRIVRIFSAWEARMRTGRKSGRAEGHRDTKCREA